MTQSARSTAPFQSSAIWRTVSDWAKRRPMTLRLADRLGRGRGRLRVLDRINPPAPSLLKPDLNDWQDQTLATAWLGHATVLLRMGGMSILTDPVFSNRVGIGLGVCTAGPRRLVAPALSLAELPPIDLILISHAHFDHLDRPTLARLPRKTPIVTAHATRDLIADLGFGQVTELRWGESTTLGPLKVTAHPANHWGARTFYDTHRGFNAYLLETAGRRVLYGGDTAYHEGFKEIGPVDLAIVGIGAYDPYIRAHANPEQAWEMANFAQARHVLPMHHSTFRLSYEPMNEPIERFLAAAGPEASRITTQQIGQVWRLSPSAARRG